MSNQRGVHIAILGASGHIGKNLAAYFAADGQHELFLVSRTPEQLAIGGAPISASCAVHTLTYAEFPQQTYDVVINCVGISDPGQIALAGASIFRLTEDYDNLVLDYLARHSGALYVFVSSGAVYGRDFSRPVDDQTLVSIGLGDIRPSDYYGLAKLNAEVKHRALAQYNIVDLRIFGFFSRYADLSAKFFLSDIIAAIRSGRPLVTDDRDMSRDYVHPADLGQLVERCIQQQHLNQSLDVYSRQPTTKFEIIKMARERYGLAVEVCDSPVGNSTTGDKDHYYSLSKRAEMVGYIPQYTSLEVVQAGLAAISS